jgi:fatty acid desaturase
MVRRQTHAQKKEAGIKMVKINAFTILSLIIMLGGIITFIYWGWVYGTWLDIGIICLAIILMGSGFVGTILSLGLETKQ